MKISYHVGDLQWNHIQRRDGGGRVIIRTGAVGRLPERYQRIVLDSLGLVTITLGIDAAVNVLNTTIGVYRPEGAAGKTYGATLGMVMVGSLLVGSIAGTAMNLHRRIESLGVKIHSRVGHGEAGRFAEGFLTASVIFCVGPLTLLGCFENGANGDPSLLMIKSMLDLFCSLALAAGLGIGVAFSVFTVIFFQGGLSVLALYFATWIPDLSQQMMNVVGGVLLLATALSLLEIKKIPVANMLPALALPPIIIGATEWLWPGFLITTRVTTH